MPNLSHNIGKWDVGNIDSGILYYWLIREVETGKDRGMDPTQEARPASLDEFGLNDARSKRGNILQVSLVV